MANFFASPQLQKKPPPAKRAAYSDRTAWLMAEMSRLAYEKFEIDINAVYTIINSSFKTKSRDGEDMVEIPKDTFDKLSKENRKAISNPLKHVNFQVKELFNENDTQGFLAVNNNDKIAALSFRGTEMDSLKDILTDLNVTPTTWERIKVHAGFWEAHEHVIKKVDKALSGLGDHAIYITGHSLGGALAIIVTRQLQHMDNLAACYTFGSPRVGNTAFEESIKTPIYRIVNCLDAVTLIPPGPMYDLLTQILRWIANTNFHPTTCNLLKTCYEWLEKYSGYRHYGDMRYLTFTNKKDFSDVNLVKNIPFIDRLKNLRRRRKLKKKKNKIPLKDSHSISIYSKKLEAYALRRNNLQQSDNTP